MVATHLLGVDLGVGDAICDVVASEPVVDAPADVAGASLSKVAPPGVVAVAFVITTVDVGEAGREPVVETGAFLGCEASFADVW